MFFNRVASALQFTKKKQQQQANPIKLTTTSNNSAPVAPEGQQGAKFGGSGARGWTIEFKERPLSGSTNWPLKRRGASRRTKTTTSSSNNNNNNKLQRTKEQTPANQSSGQRATHKVVAKLLTTRSCSSARVDPTDHDDDNDEGKTRRLEGGQLKVQLNQLAETSGSREVVKPRRVQLAGSLGRLSLLRKFRAWPTWIPLHLKLILSCIILVMTISERPTRVLINCDDQHHHQQLQQQQAAAPTTLDEQQNQQQFHQMSNNYLPQQYAAELEGATRNSLQQQQQQLNESPSEALAAIFAPDDSVDGNNRDNQKMSAAGQPNTDQQQQQRELQQMEELLEAAQSKATGTSSNEAADSASSALVSGKSAAAGASGASGTQSTTTNSTPTPTLSSSLSSLTSSTSLGEQLNAVTALLQQAGQLGLSSAQQSVALSEAIINGVTNSLNQRNQVRRPTTTGGGGGGGDNNQKQQQQSSGQHQNQNQNQLLVGQGINGNIEYDSNQGAINGFIELPSSLANLTGNKPSLGTAVKPLLLAALKTAPIKLGSVGWKLLKLLAWKKIYKTHHPKNAEIVIEQEIKEPHQADHAKLAKFAGVGGGGGGKMVTTTDLMELSKTPMKTSKMGQAYMAGGGGLGLDGSTALADHWASMMRHAGGSGGFAAADSLGPHMSASMIYQRHLLPPGHASSSGVAAGQSSSAAAAAAAAAATAAAIQSHWVQQQLAANEEAAAAAMAAESPSSSAPSSAISQRGQRSATNQTVASSGAGSSAAAAAALQRKKASFGGSNWFAAAAPAHAYAAAAAAANAAAALASHQQQQQQQHHRNRLMLAAGRAADPFEFMSSAGGTGVAHLEGGLAHGATSGGLQHALAATGLMYQSLFDNAAAMAVQHAVKLPPSGDHIGGASDFLDQSDSLAGSSFGSLSELNADPSPMASLWPPPGHSGLEGSQGGGGGGGGSGSSAGDGLMRRRDQIRWTTGSQPELQLLPASRSLADGNFQATRAYNELSGSSSSESQFPSNEAMPDFDDTPAGRMLGSALNESLPVYRLIA